MLKPNLLVSDADRDVLLEAMGVVAIETELKVSILGVSEQVLVPNILT